MAFLFCQILQFISFIHSGHFYSTPSSQLLFKGAPDYSTDTVSEFHAEAHRQLGKGLAQGPYMAARAGVEPTTLWLKAIDSTKAPPCPTPSASKHFRELMHLFRTEVIIYLLLYKL